MRPTILPTPSRAFLPTALVAFLSASLVLQPTLTAPAYGAAGGDPRAEISRFKSEGARYTRAVAAIARIEAMSLRTPADVEKAIQILEKHDPDLRYWPQRVAVIALENRTLISGTEKRVQGWVRDGLKTPEIQSRFDALRRDPYQARSWPGFHEVSRAAQAERRQHQEVFTRVTRKLHNAATELERGRNAALLESIHHRIASLIQTNELQLDLITPAYADPLIIGIIAAAVVTGAVIMALTFQPLPLPGEWPIDEEWTHERCVDDCVQHRNRCLAAVLDEYDINSFSTECVQIPECEADRLACWYQYYDDCYWQCPGFD